jgi:hypothetical protein
VEAFSWSRTTTDDELNKKCICETNNSFGIGKSIFCKVKIILNQVAQKPRVIEEQHITVR